MTVPMRLVPWLIVSILCHFAYGDERSILEAFFDQTDGPNWKNQTGWKTAAPVCSWYGITCEPLRVRLPDNNVKYTIPADVFTIADSLLVSNNPIERVEFAPGVTATLDLQDTFVKDLTGVSQLSQLRDLRYSTLVPPVAHPFSQEVCNLFNLETLHLSNNRIVGTLPACIGGLRALEELYLYSNQLTGTLPIELGKLYNLKRLSLADNGWTGTIPESLASLPNMELLNLKGGRMKEGKLSGTLPSFAKAKSLHHLFVDNNMLTGSIGENFLQHSTNLETLVTIHVENNQLTGTFPESLGRFQVLNIEAIGNHIQGPIPESYCVNRRWMNGDVGEYGCDAILCGPGKYSRTGQGPCDLCESSTDGTIGNTQCEGPSVIDNLMNNPSLLSSQQVKILAEVYLRMDGSRRWLNRWTAFDEVLMTVPDYNTDALDRLDLSSVDPCKLPGVACNPQGLVEIIELTRNNMVGTIPSALFSLPYLYILDVSYNRVEIHFDGLKHARKLNRLRLSHSAQTSLTGIENGVYLQELHLDGCDFGGHSIPKQLYSLTNLRALHLEASFLGGELSPDIRHLIQLTRLHLNENSIIGSIPKELGSLPVLEHIDLSDNEIEGRIPTEIGGISTLLSLKVNRERGVGGPLPRLSGLTRIQELELSSNSFTGTIPDDFLSNLSALNNKVTVRLGSNKLEGLVPVSLKRFSNLYLELENNRIKGIPEELCTNADWMDGEMGLVSSPCDALLCPIGFWAPTGRASTSRDTECMPCEGNAFFGETACETSGLESNGEVEILNLLFEETGGIYWNASHTNWTNVGVPICYREGILCGWKPADMNSGVTEVVLDSFGLRGRIPTEIYRLPRIRRLSFSSNPVDLSFVGIEQAQELEIVTLMNTDVQSLQGIGRSGDRLFAVNVQSAHLKGPFPSELLEISSLRSLHIGDNRLLSSIPAKLGLLTSLEYVGLNACEFIGSIPSELGALINLKRIDMSQNRLSGTLPTELGNLQSLERISFADQRSEKRLFGPLYPFASNSKLSFVNASWNDFSGTAPSDLLFSTDTDALVHIDLSHNQLSGSFPAEWAGRFVKLSVDLSANKISVLAREHCDKPEWNNGIVGIVSESQRCDAILCSPGTVALYGRQKHRNEPCRKCASVSEAPYYGSTVCLDSTTKREREVLVEFAQATGIESWYENTNWLSDRSVCVWFGVTCDSLSRVARLHLEDNGLAMQQGSTADIIKMLSGLNSLKRLVLDNNELPTLGLRGISAESRLETLSLSGVGLQSLDGVGALTRIRRLEATGNNIEGRLSTELVKLTSLEELDLSSNHLNGSIPSWIGKLTRLRTLAMSGNYITGVLPSALDMLPELHHLDLKKQRGPETIHGPLPRFASSTSLSYIDLSFNMLSGTLPTDLLSQSKTRSEMIKLWLEGNNLSGTLPPSLESFEKLDIQLADNKIEEIPEQLCRKSQWLGGSVGTVGSCNAILCPTGFFSKEGRQVSTDQPCVRCEGNSTSHFMGRTSCSDVSERKVLQRIYSSTGESWANNHLWMSDDPICAWYGVTCIGESEDDHGVLALNLTQNDMRGVLPPETFILPSLVVLDVSDNPQLRIEVSASTRMPFLETLDLFNTTLRSLDGIGQAPKLRNFRSSGLHASFPAELFQLSELEILNLAHSFLVGTLPTRIGELTSLRSLNLYGNDFHSTIPSEIARLSSLETLDLSENLFSGPLPSEAFSSLQNLKHLQIVRRLKSGRKLFGLLPRFNRAPLLETISLEGNELHGEVPNDFLSSSFYVKKINLSRNRLEGTIPSLLTQDGIDTAYGENFFTNTIVEIASERDLLLTLFSSCGGSMWKRNHFWGSRFDHCDWEGVGCSDGSVILLNLEANNLVGTLPSEIFHLSRLQSLWLRDNTDLLLDFNDIEKADNLVDVRVSKCTIKSLAGIQNAQSVAVLDLSQNHLNGPFPKELWSLSNLRVLKLNQNALTGALPSTFGRLQYLRTLNLSNNMFTGSLPSFSTSATLSIIDVTNNLLKGSIPSDFLNSYPNSLPDGGTLQLKVKGNKINAKIPLPDEFARFEKFRIDIKSAGFLSAGLSIWCIVGAASLSLLII